jgi:fatty-acyl-CoA synthase
MQQGSMSEQQGWRPTLLREVIEAGAQVSDAQLQERQASVMPSDPAILMYTSGTTGFPKGALLTHYNLVNNTVVYSRRLEPFVQREGLSMREISGNTWFPFFHVAGIVTGLLEPLYDGNTVYPLLAFDPIKALQVISSKRIFISGGVSTAILAMLNHPDYASYDPAPV